MHYFAVLGDWSMEIDKMDNAGGDGCRVAGFSIWGIMN